jgi:uncharacterized membrane protein
MQRLRTIGRIILGVAFIVAGVNHFVAPRFYRAIMPPYLPAHDLLVALSGYAEIGLGVLALVPRAHWVTRWGLVALLIAVFPANLHMALNSEKFSQVPTWALWLRLPLQAVMVAWVLWSVTPPTPPTETTAHDNGTPL